MHQDASKGLGGTRQMEKVKWVEMTENLGVIDVAT